MEFNNPPNTEIPVHKPFFVYIPGLTGGGKNLTILRGIPDLFVPSSVSTNESLKAEEKTVKEHHQNLANEIAEKAGEKDLCLIGHSLGGVEMMDVFDALLDNDKFKSKKINMTFIATPGFTARGVGGLKDFYKRMRAFSTKYPSQEQHVVFPLPESYYEKQPEVTNTLQKVFEDTPDKRRSRRKSFAESLNSRTLPAGETKEEIIQKLDQLDREIGGAEKSGRSIEKLMTERVEILLPILENFYHGALSDDEAHHTTMTQYHELTNQIASKLRYLPNAMLYYAKTGQILYEGTSKILAKVMAKAKEKGVDVKLSFVLMERDEMIKQSDINTVQHNLQAEDAGLLASFFLMEQIAHSSIGYYPEPLMDYLKTFKQ